MKILPAVMAAALALASGLACSKKDDGAKSAATPAAADAAPAATCEQAFDNAVAIMLKERPDMAAGFAKMSPKDKADMREGAVTACGDYPKEYPGCAVKATSSAEIQECDKLIINKNKGDQ